MEIDSRIAALEVDISSLKTDMAVVRSNYATKADLEAVKIDVAVIRANYVTREDLERSLNSLTWKMYGVAIVLVGAVFFVAKNVA